MLERVSSTLPRFAHELGVDSMPCTGAQCWQQGWGVAGAEMTVAAEFGRTPAWQQPSSPLGRECMQGGVGVRGQQGQTSKARPVAPLSCCVHAEAPSFGVAVCTAAAGGMLTDLAVENLVCNRRGKALCLSGSRACRSWSREAAGVQRDGKRIRLQVVIGRSRYDALLVVDPPLQWHVPGVPCIHYFSCV